MRAQTSSPKKMPRTRRTSDRINWDRVRCRCGTTMFRRSDVDMVTNGSVNSPSGPKKGPRCFWMKSKRSRRT